jgi:NAD(P)-dependent dehydrogenase (short-subunit alcohol dehydrogenase family)
MSAHIVEEEITMQVKPVALVTGANQGIGLQIAKDLAAHGFTVLVGSRDLERGEAAAKEVGPDARALQLDVRDQTSVTAAAERVRDEFDRLDVLIQNAAISNTNRLPGQSVAQYAATTRPSNVSLDEMRAVWDTNVFGVLAVYQAMLPLLRKTPNARIVNVSSGVGSLTTNSDPTSPWRSIFGPVYPASKTALNAGGDQGQRRFPGLHQDEPQRICGHRNRRGGRPRGGACCTARPGRPDRSVHALGRRNDPMVIRLERALNA